MFVYQYKIAVNKLSYLVKIKKIVKEEPLKVPSEAGFRRYNNLKSEQK